jgi:predicted AlkP superfamily pyrophosphatase or phosphodiesterase
VVIPLIPHSLEELQTKENFMKKHFVAAALSLALLAAAVSAPARADDGWDRDRKIKHVLLISVDGMHALDVANYVSAHPNSALAELSRHGITYSNASTPTNSDSFPGLLALITGGSQISHGLFYDVSYDRTIFDPTDPTCSNPLGPGNMMVFDESIDVYVGGVSQNVIDTNKVPNHIVNGKCVRMFPHNAMRANTIFEVVKSEGRGRTAWADKHPAYDIANGPSGKGVDDLFTPELTNAGFFDNTVSVVCTAQNDNLKVQGILNEIRGFTHDGKHHVGVPTVLGMNFQAVSVGQKLESDNKVSNPALACPTDTDPTIAGQPGGYTDGLGTPTAVLSYGLKKTDDALGMMIEELKDQGIYDSTLFIVTAKHGQSPINPVKTNKPGHFADLVFGLDNTNPIGILINNAGNNCNSGPCGFVQDDDIALVWLPAGQQGQTKAVADYFNLHAKELFIDEVMSGSDLTLKFKNPLNDSRTPDILIRPNYGTIYTTSQVKNAEHGGFNYSDTNVGLIVSNPGFDRRVVKTLVASSQVAPTLLKALGIDPQELDAVRKEGTPVLPLSNESDDE